MSSVKRSSDVGFELYAPEIEIDNWKLCGIRVEFRKACETSTALLEPGSSNPRSFLILNPNNSCSRTVRHITIGADLASSIVLFAKVIRPALSTQDQEHSRTNYFPISFVGESNFEGGRHYRITISFNQQSGLVAEFTKSVFKGCYSSNTKVH